MHLFGINLTYTTSNRVLTPPGPTLRNSTLPWCCQWESMQYACNLKTANYVVENFCCSDIRLKDNHRYKSAGIKMSVSITGCLDRLIVWPCHRPIRWTVYFAYADQLCCKYKKYVFHPSVERLQLRKSSFFHLAHYKMRHWSILGSVILIFFPSEGSAYREFLKSKFLTVLLLKRYLSTTAVYMTWIHVYNNAPAAVLFGLLAVPTSVYGNWSYYQPTAHTNNANYFRLTPKFSSFANHWILCCCQ